MEQQETMIGQQLATLDDAWYTLVAADAQCAEIRPSITAFDAAHSWFASQDIPVLYDAKTGRHILAVPTQKGEQQ